jgi:hypothetical protein
MLKMAHLLHCNIILFLNIIPENTDTFVQSWHKFKKFRRCRNLAPVYAYLHSFTEGHSHFFIIVEIITPPPAFASQVYTK